jgi:hypothetical protein
VNKITKPPVFRLVERHVPVTAAEFLAAAARAARRAEMLVLLAEEWLAQAIAAQQCHAGGVR